MTIKRKTQLNLSGSHRDLDADFAHIGSALFVTGSVSGSTGRFTYLSGALSASSTGQPFILAGSGVTTTFSHTNLNWTIAATGGGGTVQGNDTEIQFNQNGAFAASSSLTHFSGTLGVQALSGSLTSSGTILAGIVGGNILVINTPVLVTQSVMLFDGVHSQQLNGIGLSNGAGLIMFSGSLNGDEDPPFGINRAGTADSVDVNVKGFVTVRSGSLAVNSGSGSDSSFTVEPSTTAGQVNVIFDRTGSTGDVNFAGINVRPLYSTGSSTQTQANFILSGSLLSMNSTGYNSIGKIDFSVIAVQKDTDNYAAWTFTATVAKDTTGAVTVVAYSELDAAALGNNAVGVFPAAGWDVNINDDASIACSGSGAGVGTPIKWYAQVTKKMLLSGSGLITY